MSLLLSEMCFCRVTLSPPADLPAPILHRWNSPQTLSREEGQVRNGEVRNHTHKHTRARGEMTQSAFAASALPSKSYGCVINLINTNRVE